MKAGLWEMYYCDEIPLEFFPSSLEPGCFFCPWAVSGSCKQALAAGSLDCQLLCETCVILAFLYVVELTDIFLNVVIS